MELELPYRFGSGFDGLLGLVITELTDQVARGEVEVSEAHKQAAGLVHGGVYAAIAEALASIGTAMAVIPEGKLAQGLSNQTSFLRPILSGTIHAQARRKHRGRTTWVWEVEVTDDNGKLCVLSRVTIAVRDAPDPKMP